MFSKKLCSQLLDGNMTDHTKYVSGQCRGFYVTITATQNGLYVFQISAHSERDPGNAALGSFVESRRAITTQIQSVTVSANSITVVCSRTFLIKKVPAYLNEAIMPVIEYLVINGYASGCMQCGMTVSLDDCYNINDSYYFLCSHCAQQVEGELIEKKQEIRSNKSNLITGLVGAVLGALIGCAVYFFAWQLGYVVAIAGLITAVCAFKGYEMLGKALDIKGVLICIVVLLFAVYFANRLAWAYDAYSELKEYLSFSDCFRHIKDLIEAAELTDRYIMDLVISYVMTVLGSIGSVINAFKASSGSYKVKKM